MADHSVLYILYAVKAALSAYTEPFYRKHHKYILITERFHVSGKDRARCDQNNDVMLLERLSKADTDRRESERERPV